MGEAATTGSGIADWARVSENHSERDASRVVKKHGTTLGVKISDANVQGATMPWIDPRSWFEYIIRFGLLYHFVGLAYEQRRNIRDTLVEFWNDYRKLVPHFSLFTDDAAQTDFSRLVPLYLHGDEGRTLKKSAFMVTAIQAVIGAGFSEQRLKRPKNRQRLQVNFTGHSYSTRLVCHGIPKLCYDRNPTYFQEAVGLIIESMKNLLRTGVIDESTGETFRFILIGVKGDMPFLQKIGGLKRGWNTAAKRVREGEDRNPAKGICYMCLAGTDQHPCEDFSSNASWMSTISVLNPWDVMPAVLALPHDLSAPADFFKADVWHIIHLGCGKCFISSVLQLLLPFAPASNNDARFSWMSLHYKNFCQQTKRQSHCTKITAHMVSFGDKTGAMGNWSKGALTTTLLAWLPRVLDELQVDNFLKECKVACEDLNAVFSYLFEAPLFLNRQEASLIAAHGCSFLRAYGRFAMTQFRCSKPHLFPLYPKFHYFHHSMDRLEKESLATGVALNCLSTSCQMDEDAIGRTSRISRRVSSREVQLRTLQRYLMNAHTVWTKLGLLK